VVDARRHINIMKSNITFSMHAIGTIYSPFKKKTETPIQPSRSRAIGKVEVFSEYEMGLKDIGEFSHILLIYVFHHSSGYKLHVKPFLDNQEHGLFTTRYPGRPNQIGISIVKLLEHRKNLLIVEGIDVLDGTPLLDIKPYIPDFDIKANVETGWYRTRSEE
jgi:tRNA-Thr(GGU) m(6)t(6)A37 methyltransferase TsaA